jgi:hypothetical protein
MNPKLIFTQLALRVASSIPFSLLLATGLLAPGCRMNASSSPAGVYTLVSVNGSKLPATISHDGARLEVLSGTFTIGEDSTCSSRMVFIPPNGQEVVREVKATYTQTGGKLRMKWAGAGLTTGTVKDNTFTMDNEGMLLSYQK